MNTSEDRIDVLLVDDSRDSLDMLERGLAAAGLTTRSAESSEQAIELIQDARPEAVLLDVMMPGINGFEACRMIRQIDEHLPIIFMTGLGDAESIVHGFEVGGTDYVTKPISLEVVLARLHSHTRTARLIRATRGAIDATEIAMMACHAGNILWTNGSLQKLFSKAAPWLFLKEGAPLNEALGALKTDKGKDASDAIVLDLRGACIEVRRVTEHSEAIQIYSFRLRDPASSATWKPPKLTGRESEVLLWVARGKTNRDIAEILEMSPRTVNKHLEHIFEKLGVETRSAAADAAARQLGLLRQAV